MKSNLAVQTSNPIQEELIAVVDIETLGLKSNTIVLSVGVAVVDLHGDADFDEIFASGIEILLERDIQRQLGRTETPATVTFWEKQKEESPQACYVLNPPKDKLVHPYELMERIKSNFSKLDLSSMQWYARNPAFDMAILSDLCCDFEMDPAWRFWNSRCVKTFCERTGGIMNIKPQGYIHHSALHDAAKDAYLLRLNFEKVN